MDLQFSAEGIEFKNIAYEVKYGHMRLNMGLDVRKPVFEGL